MQRVPAAETLAAASVSFAALALTAAAAGAITAAACTLTTAAARVPSTAAASAAPSAAGVGARRKQRDRACQGGNFGAEGRGHRRGV